jgi:hypothetical protein
MKYLLLILMLIVLVLLWLLPIYIAVHVPSSSVWGFLYLPIMALSILYGALVYEKIN